jgi:hypothetical protein
MGVSEALVPSGKKIIPKKRETKQRKCYLSTNCNELKRGPLQSILLRMTVAHVSTDNGKTTWTMQKQKATRKATVICVVSVGVHLCLTKNKNCFVAFEYEICYTNYDYVCLLWN